MTCRHKKFIYNFYYHYDDMPSKTYVSIMQRCENCGLLLNDFKLKDLDQETMGKIHKLVQKYNLKKVLQKLDEMGATADENVEENT